MNKAEHLGKPPQKQDYYNDDIAINDENRE